jgi:hypothetical protein
VSDEKGTSGTAKRKRAGDSRTRMVLVYNTLDQALSLPDLCGLDVADALRSADERFAKLSEDDVARNVARAIKGRWEALRLAAVLSLACGAFDATRREGEQPGKSLERVHDQFKKAVKRAEAHVRPKRGDNARPPASEARKR